MSDRNLAAKYRPRKIDQIVGQEEVKSQLRQIVQRKKPPTTLLLSGPSGCGKTTTARILASVLNCKTQDACGKCESCRSSMQDPPTHPDVHEYNSADARGIDDVRAIIEQARFAPQYHTRVFILDECHSFTKQALDALLKITEEPPGNTIFALCTTEAYKLPTPLVGRALRLNFTHVEPADMVAHLVKVARHEGLDFSKMKEKGSTPEETKANVKKLVRTVCQLSEGRMRDAMFILDSILMMHRDGKFPTLKGLVDAYLQKFDLSADTAAIKAVYCMYAGNLKGAVSTAYDMQDNPRGLMHAARWLNDKVLCETLGKPIKFPGYSFKRLQKLLQEKELTPSLETMLKVQAELNQAEWRMNSSSVPPHMVLSECIYNAVTGIRTAAK